MAETKQTSSVGLAQPPSQTPNKPQEPDENPVPASIRGHKAVPAHPSHGLKNVHFKGNPDAKAKTFDECLAEHKAKQAKEEKK